MKPENYFYLVCSRSAPVAGYVQVCRYSNRADMQGNLAFLQSFGFYAAEPTDPHVTQAYGGKNTWSFKPYFGGETTFVEEFEK